MPLPSHGSLFVAMSVMDSSASRSRACDPDNRAGRAWRHSTRCCFCFPPELLVVAVLAFLAFTGGASPDKKLAYLRRQYFTLSSQSRARAEVELRVAMKRMKSRYPKTTPTWQLERVLIEMRQQTR